MIKHVDLFSGIGGFALALKSVVQTRLFCEIDPDAVAVLQYHIQRGMFPCAKIVGDVRSLQRCRCEVVTAGWPCTGFSSCGNRQGFANEQSALFTEVVRVCRACKPDVVILENTPEVRGEQARIEASFAKLGYIMCSGVFTAEQAGLPQLRARWFAVAYRRSSQRTLKALTTLKLPPITQQPEVKTTKQTGETRRFKLLRNAVVPRTVNLAVTSLCRQALGESPTPPTLWRTIDLRLQLKQGRVLIIKRMWPTLHGGWRVGASTLTLR